MHPKRINTPSFACFSYVLPNPSPLRDGRTRVSPVLQGIRVAERSTGTQRPAMHSATLFTANGWRFTRGAGPRCSTTARAQQHRASVTRMITDHRFYRDGHAFVVGPFPH